MTKWTTDMEAYLIVQRTVDKTPYKLLTVRMNKKFYSKFRVNDLQQKAFKLGITMPKSKSKPLPLVVVKSKNTPKKYFKPNQEQINFVHAMDLNGFGAVKITQAYNEQYGFKLNRSQITTTLKKSNSLELVKEEVKSVTVSNAPAWHSDIATRKQCRCIIALTTDLKGSAKTKATNELYNSKEYTKLEARDFIKANEDKLFSWKEKQGYSAPARKVEEVEEYIKPNVAETMWTEEEDFDILCNFYEYSIDEARTRFNCPYMVIASRLETLIDSTEPEHIELLMEATKTIKARRKQEAENAKNGFWKRRKLRKLAKREAKRERRIEYKLQRLEDMFSKRQAKLDRKVAKAEERLNKLRGE